MHTAREDSCGMCVLIQGVSFRKCPPLEPQDLVHSGKSTRFRIVPRSQRSELGRFDRILDSEHVLCAGYISR